MLQSLKSWFGQYSLLLLLLLASTSTVSCSKLPSLLTGGGPNVAANIQAGKTNTQTVGTTNNIAPTVSVRPNARVDSIDQSNTTSKVNTDAVDTIVVNEIPVWLVLLFGLLCGFLIPSPQEIIRSIVGLFRR
jgi:hypothetical protein